ncbi:MAG: hypothetical protein MJ158_03390 [Alphaproteobacteria bacterium]|nr:hypothetical protein [Alphaproteobacteria bacterium]
MIVSNRFLFVCFLMSSVCFNAVAVPSVRILGGQQVKTTSPSTKSILPTSGGVRVAKKSAVIGSSANTKTRAASTNASSRLPVSKIMTPVSKIGGGTAIKKISNPTSDISTSDFTALSDKVNDVESRLDGLYSNTEIDDFLREKLNITDVISNNDYVYIERDESGVVEIGLDMDSLADKISSATPDNAKIVMRIKPNTKLLQWNYEESMDIETSWHNLIDFANFIPNTDYINERLDVLADNVENLITSVNSQLVEISNLKTRVDTLEQSVNDMDIKITDLQINAHTKYVYDSATETWTLVNINNDFDTSIFTN